MASQQCGTCGGEARVGTIEELKATKGAGCAVILRPGDGKPAVMSSRCAPTAKPPVVPAASDVAAVDDQAPAADDERPLGAKVRPIRPRTG